MTARVAVAAATAALTLAAVPAAAPAAKKKKAKTPASWVKAQKDAKALYGVLRRPGTAADKLPKGAKKAPPAAISRKVGALSGRTYYLVVRATQLCLAVKLSTGQTPEFCVPVAKVKSGSSVPKALESAGGSNFDYVVAVPDGATVGRTYAGTTTPQTVTDNAALIGATPFGGSVDVTLKSGTVLKYALGLSL
jgi:hypothetical protein